MFDRTLEDAETQQRQQIVQLFCATFVAIARNISFTYQTFPESCCMWQPCSILPSCLLNRCFQERPGYAAFFHFLQQQIHLPACAAIGIIAMHWVKQKSVRRASFTNLSTQQSTMRIRCESRNGLCMGSSCFCSMCLRQKIIVDLKNASIALNVKLLGVSAIHLNEVAVMFWKSTTSFQNVLTSIARSQSWWSCAIPCYLDGAQIANPGTNGTQQQPICFMKLTIIPSKEKVNGTPSCKRSASRDCTIALQTALNPPCTSLMLMRCIIAHGCHISSWWIYPMSGNAK